MIEKMKVKIKTLLLATAVLFTAFGCRMVAEQDPEGDRAKAAEKMYSVHFVSDEIETRTVFGDPQSSGEGTEYPTRWTANDTGIAVSLNLNGARQASVSPSADYKSATFDAQFPQSDVVAPYTFYALSPFSACVGATSNHGGYHFNIPTEQTPLASSCDEAAQVLVASQQAAAIEDFSSIQMHFTHLTAYGKLLLKSISLPQGAEIQAIDLTASVPFAGRFYYNFAEAEISESSSSRTVTIKMDNLEMDGSGNIADIWFACAPADLGGGTVKVDINTSMGVLSRTVSIPTGRLAFQAGRVSKFTVNMADAVFTQAVDRWVLVSDASSLRAGDEIIIATSATAGSAYAMSTTQNNNNRGRASITIVKDSDNKMIIQNPGTSVEVVKLVTGAYSNYFYLQEATSTQGRYIGTTSSTNNNYLRSNNPSTATNSTNIGYYNWAFYISNNVATITAYQSVTSGWITTTTYYKQIRYNSNLFAAYKSTSQTTAASGTTGSNVYIYRKEAGGNVDADPILEQNEYGAYLTSGNKLYGTGCQLSREYMNDGTVTFAILKPATYNIYEFNGIPTSPAKGDTFTLNFRQITGRNESEANYSVTVVKVDGPKVWATAGSGNGFIVKK